MPIELRRAYLEEIRFRYRNSTKKQKGLILNEFCLNCGYDRKYAIKILNRKVEPRTRRPGPKAIYTLDVINALKELWLLMSRICSKNMSKAMPIWLPHYKASDTVKLLLLQISPSTIDRVLKPHRKPLSKGISTTRGHWVKSKIPIKLLDHNITMPGYLEADTVAHCGNSAAGEFANSITMTDLFSAWTDNRAVWTKTSDVVLDKISDIERKLPFSIVGFACDNGSEFLNEDLHRYLKNRQAPIHFVRRRPYKKNDAAHVEQKNWTHVRQLFAYDRIDEPTLVPLMNEIYQAYWNPLRNYFTPSMKLKSKERIGGRIKKVYEEPKTPYQRLMESSYVPEEEKKSLRANYLTKNPIYLKQQLEIKLKEFFDLVDDIKRKKRNSAS